MYIILQYYNFNTVRIRKISVKYHCNMNLHILWLYHLNSLISIVQINNIVIHIYLHEHDHTMFIISLQVESSQICSFSVMLIFCVQFYMINASIK